MPEVVSDAIAQTTLRSLHSTKRPKSPGNWNIWHATLSDRKGSLVLILAEERHVTSRALYIMCIVAIMLGTRKQQEDESKRRREEGGDPSHVVHI